MERKVLKRRIRARISEGVYTSFLKIVFVICVAVLLTTAFDAHFRPLIEELAMAQVHSAIVKKANDAVADELEDSGGMYEQLVIIEKDEENQIVAVRADVIKMNRMKTGVMERMLEAAEQIDAGTIGVPLGSLLGGTLLYGSGPKIPVSILPAVRTEAAFISEFTQAGINQTRYRVLIEVSVNLGVQLLGARTEATIVTQVPAAEMVLVGNVPESYTYIEDTENGRIGKLNDYRAGE